MYDALHSILYLNLNSSTHPPIDMTDLLLPDPAIRKPRNQIDKE